MSEIMVDARDEKIRQAYHEALLARHGSASVALRVSREVWDYLMSIREIDTTKAGAPGSFRGMEWLTSVPIICDTSSSQPEGFSIVVEARTVIT